MVYMSNYTLRGIMCFKGMIEWETNRYKMVIDHTSQEALMYASSTFFAESDLQHALSRPEGRSTGGAE